MELACAEARGWPGALQFPRGVSLEEETGIWWIWFPGDVQGPNACVLTILVSRLELWGWWTRAAIPLVLKQPRSVCLPACPGNTGDDFN